MLVRARAIKALPRFAGKDWAAYLKEAMQDPQWVVRKAAIQVLAPRGDANALKAASDALRDSSLPIEEDAFDLLSTIRETDARSMVLAVLLDPSAPTREKLMRAVLARELPEQEAFFTALLARGDEWAASKLAEVRREYRRALVERLLRVKEPKVHQKVLKFLFDSRLSVDLNLVRPLLKSPDSEVRNLAAELLASAGDTGAAKLLLPLADGDQEAQLRFLRAAASAPSSDLIGRLKRFLAPETPAELLVHVYRAFAGSDDQEVRQRVEEDLKSTNMARRVAATAAVGKLMGPRALPRLYELLVDGSPLVRRHAAEAIGELAQAESVEVLERALRDTEREVRLAVMKALGKIHDKSVVGVASFAVYDNDPEIRKAAILAVCDVNHESAMPILRVNVEDPDPDIRYNVFRAMVYLDPKQAMEYFDRAIAGLKGDDLVALTETYKDAFLPFLQKAAQSERAWARLGSLRAVRLLPAAEKAFLKEVAATDPYSDARRAAIARLAELSCPDAMEVADAVAADKDAEVRIAAIGVMERCGDNSVIEKLKGALLDLEENVRVAAAAALMSFPKTGKQLPPAAKPKRK